ncbi:Amino-acid permease RocE [compost metagenome]
MLMIAISIFGALFAWMMIFFTHYRFRRYHERNGGGRLAFRMWGFPGLTLLGLALMAAILLTTAFVPAFRMTLVFGVPFLALLALAYRLYFRGTAQAISAQAQEA